MKLLKWAAIEQLMISLKPLQRRPLKLIKYYKLRVPTGFQANAG
jgi:hypothetical protein